MAHPGDAFQMKVARHQLALDLALMDGARHGIVEMMRDVRTSGSIDDQGQAGFAPVYAHNPNVLPSATEEPHRLHQPERTTHGALIDSLQRWLSREHEPARGDSVRQKR